MAIRIAIENCSKCYDVSGKIDKNDIIQAGVRDSYANVARKALVDEIMDVDLGRILNNLSEIPDEYPDPLAFRRAKAYQCIDDCLKCKHEKPIIKESYKHHKDDIKKIKENAKKTSNLMSVTRSGSD